MTLMRRPKLPLRFDAAGVLHISAHISYNNPEFKKGGIAIYTKRTDLAVEARDLYREASKSAGDPDGVVSEEYEAEGLKVHAVDIKTDEGAQKLGKPVGRYVTVDIDPLISHEENAFERAVNAISGELKKIMQPDPGKPVMVVGLGNKEITPDSIGPRAADKILATRHLLSNMPDQFGMLKPVTVISPGVLGMTGIETGEIISGVVGKVPPSVLIIIDALASRQASRLCNSVQLSNTGIAPGSGVKNDRFEINRQTMGVPCISIGVPTVVDAATLAADVMDGLGIKYDMNALAQKYGDTFVTLKDIDVRAADCSKVVAYGINSAIQTELSIEDIDMFLS